MRDLIALEDPRAVVRHRRGRRPDGARSVHRDPVRPDVVGPGTAVDQCSVGDDVERREASRERLAHDERRVVRRDDHAVREREITGDASNRAVGCDERDHSAARFATAEEVELDAVDVDVAAAVDNDLTATACAHVADVGVHHERTVGLAAQEGLAGDEQATVGEPVRRPAQSGPAGRDHFAVAVEIDGEHLVRAPVGEPEAAVVPAGRLEDPETVDEHARLGQCLRCHADLPSRPEPEPRLRELALGEGKDLVGRNLEHERFTTFMMERAVRDVEVPVTAVLRLPLGRKTPEVRVVGHALRGPFDDYVESRLPRVVAGRERALRVVREVDALLFACAGAEVERAVLPHRGEGRDVRTTVGSHRRDPGGLSRWRGRSCFAAARWWTAAARPRAGPTSPSRASASRPWRRRWPARPTA